MLKCLPILLVLAADCGTAQAEPLKFTDTEKAMAKVAVVDLNLGSEEGAAMLRRRIMLAARSLCESGSQPLSVGARLAQRQCVRDSLRPALARADRLIAQWRSAPRLAQGETIRN